MTTTQLHLLSARCRWALKEPNTAIVSLVLSGGGSSRRRSHRTQVQVLGEGEVLLAGVRCRDFSALSAHTSPAHSQSSQTSSNNAMYRFVCLDHLLPGEEDEDASSSPSGAPVTVLLRAPPCSQSPVEGTCTAAPAAWEAPSPVLMYFVAALQRAQVSLVLCAADVAGEAGNARGEATAHIAALFHLLAANDIYLVFAHA